MAQRITAIMAALTAAAAIVVAVLLWRGIDQQARATAALQQSNADLMQRLVTLLEQQPATVTEEPAEDRTMRHLDLRLVLDDPDGPPAVGYELEPAGKSPTEDLVRLAGPQTDEQGRAKLSMNRIGKFYLAITTPDGWNATTLLLMGPEHPQEVTLVVPSPATPVPGADVAIHIPRPEELREQEYLFDVTLARTVREVGGMKWFYAPQGINAMFGREGRLLVAGDGRIIGRVVEVEDSRLTWGQVHSFAAPPDPHRVVFKTVPVDELPAGEYSVRSVAAYEPLDDPQDRQRDRLGAVTPFSYEFAEGTTRRSLIEDAADWTIELPDFVWRRAEGGEMNAQAGGGFF